MPSIVSEATRIAKLSRFVADKYRDVAIRLRNASTGELGPLYGGRWNMHEGRYLAPWEMRYQELSCRTEAEREEKRLKVFVRDVHGKQADLCADLTSKILLGIGSRRGGKSRGSAIKAAVMSADAPGVDGEIISPTFDKSQIMWRYLRAAIPPSWVEDSRAHEHWLQLWTGTRIKFISAHKPDSVVGEGVGWIGFDELQSISESAWTLALPAVSDGGTSMQIWGCGTPRMGEFKQRYERIRVLEGQGRARILHFTFRDNVFLESGEGTIFELAGALLDPRKRAQELDAEFTPEEGLVYYRFDRAEHDKSWKQLQVRRASPWARDITASWLRDEIESQIDAQYIIGVDYGMGRQYATVYKLVKVHGMIAMWAVAEAYRDRDWDVEDLADELVARGYYPAVICDDASGAKSKGGRRSAFRFEAVRVANGKIVQLGGEQVFEVHHYASNRPVADRVDALNALMGNSLGQKRWYCDVSECPRLVESLENQELENGKPKRSKPGQRSYHDMPDAAGYPAIYLFPAAVDYEQQEKAAAAKC